MAHSRTYIPGLLLVLNAAYRYISRWSPKLQATLTPEQFEHVTGCLAQLSECLAAIPPIEPEPNA